MSAAKDCMEKSAAALADAEYCEHERAKHARHGDGFLVSRDYCLYEAQRYEQLALHAMELERKKWADMLRRAAKGTRTGRLEPINHTRPMAFN